ncbi:MAG: aldo/keto reductase [Gammaproteobacteria bacterium]|nr:aldo/keto reductase [Gammaproteobacteria bacterium]
MLLPQAALAFVLAHREIATVIPGARSRAQLQANLAAASQPMQADLVAAIRALWQAELADDPLPW